MTTELRPLSFGELLDRAFSLYRSHLLVFVGIMAAPQVLLLIVSFCWGLVVLGAIKRATSPGDISLLMVALGITAAVMAFAYAAAYGGTTFAVSELYLGRKATIRTAYEKVRGRMGALLKLELGVFVRMLGWLVTIILSPIAILLLFWYALSVPALLLENIPAGQALKRSRFLTRGQLDRIFAIEVLMGIVTVVLTMVIEAPFLVAAGLVHGQPPYWLSLLTDLAGSLVQAFTAPLMMIALVLLYYDVRVRKEGYDLELMMSALDEAGPGPVPDSAVVNWKPIAGLFPKPGRVYRDGKSVVVTDGTPLPPRCVKCGQPIATEPKARKYSWHSRWLYLLIFLGLIVYVIVALAVRKQWKLAVPLCEAHRMRQRQRRWIGASLLIAGIPIMILLMGLLSSAGGVRLSVVTGVGLMIAGAVFLSRSHALLPNRIEDTYASFAGAGEDFLCQLPGPGSGSPAGG
jgi:hypothetical protein